MSQKSVVQKSVEQGTTVGLSYAFAQPFGVYLSAWLTARGIPMPEPIATGGILVVAATVGRVVIHAYQHWVGVRK
jgi:Zn-dependent protease